MDPRYTFSLLVASEYQNFNSISVNKFAKEDLMDWTSITLPWRCFIRTTKFYIKILYNVLKFFGIKRAFLIVKNI